MRVRIVNGKRQTSTPYRSWPVRARLIERLYRWTHGGQIRTLVIREHTRSDVLDLIEGREA